jgi:methylase of polypeptide subunit release factors
VTSPQETAAIDFITRGVQLCGSGATERAVIENLVASLRPMFPEAPAWIDAHIREAETQVRYDDQGKSRRAFIDNLVGYTTIEYERDLRNQALFDTGYGQVKEHVAGLLNAGAPKEKILGVLSDTLRWRAYRIKKVKAKSATLGPADIELDEVAVLDVGSASKRDAEMLIDFLATHLGRESALRLAASTVALDLGFDSTFGKRHLAELATVVDEAFAAEPKYVKVIEASFIGSIGDASSSHFDRALYASELYVVTLAKLLCANVIAQQALNSSDNELAAILDGEHFRAKGLENLVEYDSFGWLNARPWVDRIVPIAREMQRGLRSYDFASPAAEDLFGLLLAQLAVRSQRLLLGQEATPPWLAARLARQLIDATPKDRAPRFLDMCCGSGSLLIEVVKLAKERHGGVPDQDAVLELSQVATGFDIDPLAVLLAKVNWVITARDWLHPFDGSRRVSVPIYQADSLFVTTPIGDTSGPDPDIYPLQLHDQTVDLPAFLVSPTSRALFDALLDRAYRIGMAAARTAEDKVEASTLEVAVDDACGESGATLDKDQRERVLAFIDQLVETLARLQRQHLNGIWAFVLRNSYRPGLVVGQFNGLISNPPWLALSKLADNPYREALDSEAAQYAIKPKGPAHLHTELATTFLLHAVDRYLSADAVVGVILPDTITNGFQHEPFRRGAYATAPRPLKLDIRELWRIEPGTFKNEAVVVIGRKTAWVSRAQFAGALVGESTEAPRTFQVIKLASDRTAWSDVSGATSPTSFDEIAVRQGADVMPRRAVFFEAKDLGGGRHRLAPIDKATSKSAYLLKDEKRLTDFKIRPTTVPSRFIFDVLISKHVVPFDIGLPAKALLPIERNSGGAWAPVSSTKLAASPPTESAFNEILAALGDGSNALSLDDYFALLDTRRKLAQQRLPAAGYLFVQGAGGGVPCAAYAPLSDFNTSRLIIDQTLYWSVVDDEDEAIYLVGLFNSDALNTLIAEFQPQGAFGRRHVHELPAKVTPGFDKTDPVHVAVVSATRKLVAEYAAARTKNPADEYADPNQDLSRRRRKLRELLRGLPSFSPYDTACHALYRALASP